MAAFQNLLLVPEIYNKYNMNYRFSVLAMNFEAQPMYHVGLYNHKSKAA